MQISHIFHAQKYLREQPVLFKVMRLSIYAQTLSYIVFLILLFRYVTLIRLSIL